MIYHDTTITCQSCGQTFPWPVWAQEWSAASGAVGPPRNCLNCQVAAAIARVNSAPVVPMPPWDGLPLRTVTRGGLPGDPVNIAIEGAREEVLAAFARSGARSADPLSLRDDLHLAEDAIRHGTYLTAPVSRLFLFGRVEDFAVETELGSVASRMHARFWDTGRRDAATSQQIWLGALSLDVGIELLRRDHIPIGTTHRIYPDLDVVRSVLLVTLIEAGLVAAVIRRPGIGPTPDGRNGGGDPFFTAGDVVVVVLAAQSVPQDA